MSGINKVIVLGNVGMEPEVKTFQDGNSITNISVATSKKWKNKQGEPQEKTQWHNITLQDRGNYKLAQIAAQYLHKGSKVYIEGELDTKKWQATDGTDRYMTRIIASNIQLLDSKSDTDQTQANQQGAQMKAQANAHAYQQAHSGNAHPGNAQPVNQQTAQAVPQGFDDFNEDFIPF